MSGGVRECFTCFNDIPGDTIPYNATAFTGSPAFGSELDGAGTLEIHVCDSCLTERRDRVVRLTVTRTEMVRREPWEAA